MKELKFLSLVMVAGAAALLTACTSESENGPSNNISYESIKAAEQVPVTFGTYMGETPVTRTGATGDIANTAALATKHFGVFAYYTHGADAATYLYPNTMNGASVDAKSVASAMPNFMWNQEVSSSDGGTTWTYSPIKYWPNDFNGNNQAVDNQSPAAATGTEHGRVSFFAYAPYANVRIADGGGKSAGTPVDNTTTGITVVSTNTYTGNPTVTYVIDPDGKNVDLLWGAYSGTTDNVLATTPGTTNTGGYVQYYDHADAIMSYLAPIPKVNINLQKQKTGGYVGFEFYHALAQVGGKVNSGLQIIADVDGVQTTPSGKGTDVGAGTRITVKRIQITNTDASMPSKGELDLANGKWDVTVAGPSKHITFTHIIDPVYSDDVDNNTWQLNEEISDSGSSSFTTWDGQAKSSDNTWESGVPLGVTTTAKDVYDSDTNPSPLVFLPGTIPHLTIFIDYMVRTSDKNLDGGFSQVEQKITKTVAFTSAVQANKQYKLLLHLGMTSVNVTASVAPWTEIDPDGSTPADVNLPINVN